MSGETVHEPGPARTPVVMEAGGGPSLFERMGENHGPVLHRWAMARIGHDGEAWDFVQDAFVRALSTRPSVKDDQELRAWLMVVMRNLVIDHHRSFETRHILAEGLDRIASPVPVREPRWASVDFAVVRAVLPRLHAGQREVFELRAAGWTTNAVAEHLGVPVCTVCTRLFRARRHLREMLAAFVARIEAEDDPGECSRIDAG
jgi:RNA polymerase sigma-70 factor (ECF subfamily)